jgi:hypothetical protein
MLGRAGPEASRAAERGVQRQPGGGVQGLPPDFAKRAAQQRRRRKEGKKKELFTFLIKEIKQKLKLRFELNQTKMDAPASMQEQTPIFH